MDTAQQALSRARPRSSRDERLQLWMTRLLLIVGVMMAFGLACVFSTTVYMRLALGRSAYVDFFQHLLFYGLGAVVALATIVAVNLFAPARRWLRFVIPTAFFASLILVALVQVPGLGVEAFGSRRFLALGSLTFQPSELLKISLLLYLAQLLCWWRRYPERSSRTERRRTAALSRDGSPLNWLRLTREERPLWPDLPKRCALAILLAVGLTVIQPDLGTALLIMGGSCITLMLAGVDWRQLTVFLCLLALLGGAAILMDTDKYQYASQRIHTWLNPMANEDSTAYQITQARGALAVGGVFGRGYLKSDQKINRLPLSTKDFVYPVMVEELGYVGGVAIILLFVGLAWAGLGLSQCCRDHFNRTVIAGLAYAVCLQGLVNIAVSIGTLPLSGLTLPYFSEGGTSVVVTTEAVGMMLALALSELRQARRERRAAVSPI